MASSRTRLRELRLANKVWKSPDVVSLVSTVSVAFVVDEPCVRDSASGGCSSEGTSTFGDFARCSRGRATVFACADPDGGDCDGWTAGVWDVNESACGEPGSSIQALNGLCSVMGFSLKYQSSGYPCSLFIFLISLIALSSLCSADTLSLPSLLSQDLIALLTSVNSLSIRLRSSLPDLSWQVVVSFLPHDGAIGTFQTVPGLLTVGFCKQHHDTWRSLLMTFLIPFSLIGGERSPRSRRFF